MEVRQLFKNLKKEAECPLCLDTFKKPKTLPCLHSFCLVCLDKLANFARRQLQTTVNCPVCLTTFQIPEGDTFAGLPASFHLNRLVDILALGDASAQAQNCSSCEGKNVATCYCFDCHDFFCDACVNVHNRMKMSRQHRIVFIKNLEAKDVEELIHRPTMCAEKYHEKEQLEYYCQECKSCICHKCGLMNHNRHTMVDIQPLPGSPWSVHVTPHQYKPLFTFGSLGEGQGQFKSPKGIALNERTGNIAVVDSGNKRIQILSSEGEYLTEFGQKGPGAERLGYPYSVAFTSYGDVIVSHRSFGQPSKISMFAEKGQFIKHITNEHLKDPLSVSVGRDGHLIVSDWTDKTINVLSPDGTELLQSFSAPGCVEPPTFAVYHQDKFFVSYIGADCVKVFNKEGMFLYNIGSEGPGDRQLNHPVGLAVDKFNNLIVCDCYNNRLQVFTLGGSFVTKIEGQLTGLGSPWFVAVSNDGHVFVTDDCNQCVHVFQ